MNLEPIFKKYNPKQPRYPKGSPLGGQWRSSGGPGGQAAGKGQPEGMFDVEANYARVKAAAIKGLKASGKIKDPGAEFEKMMAIEREVRDSVKEKSTDRLHKMKNGVFTPERMAMHQKIIDDMFKDADKFKPPPGEKPHVLMLAGKPGAGKSQFGKKLKIYDPDKYLVLDSDAFKEKFPEYDPERPGYVHREASDLMNRAGVIARAMGLNIVYDMTMKKPPTDLVKHFKNHDYIVEMHHMNVSQDTSLERAVYRWANDGKDGKRGRLVPPSVIAEMTRVAEVFKEAKKQADHWTEYDHETLGNPVRVDAGGKYKTVKAYLKRMFAVGYAKPQGVKV